MNTRALLITLFWATAACGDDDHFVGVGRGLADAAIDGAVDGATGRVQVPDGSVLLPDGAIVPLDAGGGGGDDGGMDPAARDPAMCQVGSDHELLLDVPFATEGGFSLAPADTTGFGLALVTSGCAKAVSTARLTSTGAFATPAPIFDECKAVTELSLLAATDGFRLTWVDNSTGSAELHSLLLGDDLAPRQGSTRKRLTDNALLEQFPASANLAGAPMLAWIAQDPASRRRRVFTQQLDGSAAATELVAEGSGHAPIRVAIAQAGKETGAVAWVEEIAEQGVWLQTIDKLGGAVGEPARVSDLASAGSTVDLATRDEEGGGVLYSAVIQNTTHEVRFRRLDDTGKLSSTEIKVVSPPLQAKDASLTRVGAGYAVVYRALPVVGSLITTPQIRMTFIGKEGNPARDTAGRLISHEIAPAERDGGRTTVRLSIDGQLLVGYVDAGAGGTKLKLVRKRLDCP